MSGLRFDGWVPFRMYWQDGEPGVEWFYIGAKRFGEPFFEATAHFEVQTPFNSLFRFRTPVRALAEWHAVSPGLKPAGFIFHLSRCGSTLITQMLASLPQSVVLSEAGVLDRMLRAHERAPEVSIAQRVEWLQWLVSALGQRRTGVERRLFIKFDPRNIADLPLLRLAFPDVPWIFVYRNPVEVMVSNIRAASPLVTRGILRPDFLNFDISLVAGMEDDEYAARVLGIIAETGVRHAAGAQGKLIEYRQLPDVVWGDLGRHFGLDFTPEDVERLKPVATLDAKHPKQRFESDTEAKKREAGERMRLLAEQWIEPHYAKLEEIRRQQERGFETFRRLVLEEPVLLERLSGLEREAFLETAVREASRAGIPLQRYDVERAIAEARIERQRRLL
jgi:sulfotransferase family protein